MNQFAQINQPDEPEIALPHSVEAEQQLLGALLANNEGLDRVNGLSHEHFFDPVHARIFKTICALVHNDRLASPITLKPIFETDPGLKELGGPAYLRRLVGAAMMAVHIPEYAKMLIELHEARNLISISRTCIDALQEGGAVADAVEVLERHLLSINGSTSETRSMSLLAAATKAISEMNDRFQNGSTGVPSGLADFDRVTGGFHRAEFTIIGGATSMGKTTLGTWIAYSAAKNGVGVGFATLEMGESQLYQRINSIDSRIPYQAQRRELSETDFRKVIATTQEQAALPIELFSSECRTIHGIFTEARKLQRKWPPNEKFKGLGMLVIDYIQLVKGQGTSLEVLPDAAIECKNIAKRLDIPVIALAQVNRTIGQRDNKVPNLSDLRGSGDLEFAADNVIFCHRPEYYLTRELQNPSLTVDEIADIQAAMDACKGTMDIIIAKQRMGSIDQCRVGCDMGTNRFWDRSYQQDFGI